MSKALLSITPCEHADARRSVEDWHYSRSLPTPPLIALGVKEDGHFIGAILFSVGSCQHLHRPYGLERHQVLELSRVALADHRSPVSRIVAISMRLLQNHRPAVKLLVSYADPRHGHHGGIYQAMNWAYTGMSSPDAQYEDKSGRIWHRRQVSATGFKTQYGKRRPVPRMIDCRRIPIPGKHRFVYVLDKDDSALSQRVEAMARPYPKRELLAA